MVKGIMIHGTMGPSWSTKTWGNAMSSLVRLLTGAYACAIVDDINLHKMMPNPSGNKIIIKNNP